MPFNVIYGKANITICIITSCFENNAQKIKKKQTIVCFRMKHFEWFRMITISDKAFLRVSCKKLSFW